MLSPLFFKFWLNHSLLTHSPLCPPPPPPPHTHTHTHTHIHPSTLPALFTASAHVLWYNHKDLVVCFKQQDVSLIRSRGLIHEVVFLLVLPFDITHTSKETQHTQGPIGWHIHTNIHHLLCGQSSYLYYIEWIIWCYQNLSLQSFIMSLLFQKYWLIEITYLLIRFNKTRFLPWNTKNTDRYGANKQNKNHHCLCKKIRLERFG